MKQDAMKKGCTEELTLTPFTNIHTNEHNHAQDERQHLKLQQEEN